MSRNATDSHEVALGYLKLTQPKTSLVFGAETVAQVTQNIQCWQKVIPPVLINVFRKLLNKYRSPC